MKHSKVILVTNIIPPYRVPLFTSLAKELKNFLVLALSPTEQNRQWQKEKKYLFPVYMLKHTAVTLVKGHAELHIQGIFFKLIQEKPDVVITSGYDQIAYWQALIYTKIFRKKFILWNGTTLLSEERKFSFSSLLKKVFIYFADQYVTYGTKATEYLLAYGADEKKIITGCNTVDTEIFSKEVERIRKDTKCYYALRRRYAKDDDTILLYCGRLIDYKGVELLLQALDKHMTCIIIGDGPQKTQLEELVASKELTQVFFLGHIPYNELSKYYAISNVFVFPTQHEPWGLVVNEALAAGIPVLTSNRCGAAFDLINERNGEIIDFVDTKETKIVLQKWYNKKQIQREDIIKTVAHCSIKKYKKSFLMAIKKVTL